MEEQKQERKVIHLQIDGEHYYYGSIVSLFEDFSKEKLGFSIYQVKNNIGKKGIMENEKCIIRQGIVKTKKSGRGNPYITKKNKGQIEVL